MQRLANIATQPSENDERILANVFTRVLCRLEKKRQQLIPALSLNLRVGVHLSNTVTHFLAHFPAEAKAHRTARAPSIILA